MNSQTLSRLLVTLKVKQVDFSRYGIRVFYVWLNPNFKTTRNKDTFRALQWFFIMMASSVMLTTYACQVVYWTWFTEWALCLKTEWYSPKQMYSQTIPALSIVLSIIPTVVCDAKNLFKLGKMSCCMHLWAAVFSLARKHQHSVSFPLKIDA